MTRNLQGQRVLITGASSGIGKALAEQAARAGMRVLLVGRSAEVLHELARQLTAEGHTAVAEPADITNPADRERLFEAARKHFGGLDVLINNAGIGTQGPFDASSEELLRQVMEVNFFAPAELIRGAVPLLQQGRDPAVVQVASMTGRRSMPFWTEYSAS
ncbi:MAG: SDR family NAD(P)-dependent oxidoreductase, partial [Planctomycetia bacterium]|nr:SDR family NAD(P)-dependent oxidoreductase [Planctomycetia bacterium]